LVPPTPLEISLKIQHVSKVDTKDQTFDFQGHIYLTWPANDEDIISWKKHQKTCKDNEHAESWKPDRVPEIELDNGVGEVTLEYGEFELKNNFNKINKEKYYIRVQIKVASTCVELFELENFPFDEQDLSIHIHECSGIKKWEFVPETRGVSPEEAFSWINIVKRHFVAPEWKFVSALAEITNTSGINSKSGTKYSVLTVRLKMLRQWRSYKNILWPMMILTALSLFVFAIDSTNIADRLSYSVTLLLTVVAFQNSVQDQLPDLPMLTILDKFVMLSFGFISLVMGETILLTLNSYTELHDDIALCSFVIIWIMIHLYIFYLVVKSRKEERKKIFQSSKELAPSETIDFLISCKCDITTWKEKTLHVKYPTIDHTLHVFRQDETYIVNPKPHYRSLSLVSTK